MKRVAIFGLLIIGAILLFAMFSNNKLSITDQSKKETANVLMSSRPDDTPTLDLPLRYFTDDSVTWGSVNTARNSDDKNTWQYAAIDGGDAYQSFPSKTITLSSDDFSNSSEQLPPIKSKEQILKQDVEEGTPWQWLYEQEINEYGDLATRFLPSERAVDVKTFDVDRDGKDETIIFLCGVGGNHCPHRIVIVKDKKIIFSVSAGLVDLNLTKSDTGNGFYVGWTPSWDEGGKWNVGLCCTPGYRKTRFVYESKKFKPVYEQEILYFKIENTE
jgi:hypothetical protein